MAYQEILAGVIERIPMQRLASATEIAYAVTFLLDDRAGYITGVVLPVNGGMDMWMPRRSHSGLGVALPRRSPGRASS